ncbi:MAG: acyl-CoA dehydrogenase family protein [Ignavibacteriales bacterium]|nr:acyl-CoA dehydrogenase family protein [Ignavibacteriales bacterium]
MNNLIESRVSGDLGVLVFNNPPMNVFTAESFSALEEKFEEFRHDPAVKAIVFTGNGFVFSAGVDVKLIYELAAQQQIEEVATLLKELHQFFLAIDRSAKPTVAAVNGYCLGGGLELALSCDFILAGLNAQFGFPEVALGLIPGLGGTQRLTRRVGVRNSLRLLLGGTPIPGSMALELGLVDCIVGNEFIPNVKEIVQEIIGGCVKPRSSCSLNPTEADLTEEDIVQIAKGKPAIAVEAALSAVKEGAALSLEEALFGVELHRFLDCLATEDALEGLASFAQKRAPHFLRTIGGNGGGNGHANHIDVVEREKTVPEKTEQPITQVLPWESEDYQTLRNLVREFAQKELQPKVAWMEEHEEVPRQILSQMGELGVFGVMLPESYGGSGLGKMGACVLADELTYTHPSTAIVLGAHTSLACEALYLFGTENQKERYLQPALKGEKIGALSTTESDIGSDVGAMRTRATKIQNGWVLRGSKQFITNGEIADFIVVFAQTDPLGHNKTLAAFIVDTSSKGFAITRREKKMGLHASRTNSFSLDDVFVPEENVLGEIGRGFKMVMRIFNNSRITLAASCIGFIRRAIDESIAFSKSRMLFGEPMYMKQNTQLQIAQMETKRMLIESAVFQAAWKCDRGLDIRNEAAAVKYSASELADQAVDAAVQLHGGAGFMQDFPIERFSRDVRVFRLFEGTSEIQLLTIAKEMIKSRFI